MLIEFLFTFRENLDRIVCPCFACRFLKVICAIGRSLGRLLSRPSERTPIYKLVMRAGLYFFALDTCDAIGRKSELPYDAPCEVIRGTRVWGRDRLGKEVGKERRVPSFAIEIFIVHTSAVDFYARVC